MEVQVAKFPKTLQLSLMVVGLLVGNFPIVHFAKRFDLKIRLIPYALVYTFSIIQLPSMYVWTSQWANGFIPFLSLLNAPENVFLQLKFLAPTIVFYITIAFTLITGYTSIRFGSWLYWILIKRRIFAIIPELR